jgi:ADP-ribose pyrophosphatase
MRVSQHSVRLPQANSVISDWLWIDYHNRINVLVESHPGQFAIFQQTKYALEGKWSKAIVGGIIEPHSHTKQIPETPLEAAQREVYEEVDQTTCKEWVLLGRYRTDVNRGMGWTYTYLATQCARDGVADVAGVADAAEVGGADTERQTRLTMSLSDLKRAVMSGEFVEIQWTATVALAIMHIEAQRDAH